MTPEQEKALQYLFENAMHSKLLSPVHFQDVQKAAQIVLEGLKKEEVKKDE
jgi:hypothetical protein